MPRSEPRERPILFSGPMVKAILAGEKTQTRRVITAKGAQSLSIAYWRPAGQPENAGRWVASDGLPIGHIACPYGAPGDRLWVRETFREADVGVRFRADLGGADVDPGGWTPSIFMRRRLSRIDLEVTAVRVERLQEITEEDARAEGSSFMPSAAPGLRYRFHLGWDSLNEKRGYGWAKNPWVWVVSFKRLRP